MRQLALIRHAKSSWKFEGLADADRPLNKRGRHDAPMMGNRLAASGIAFERIISSPALRALRTAQFIATALDLSFQNLRVDPLLYGASTDQLLRRIQSLGDRHHSIALVGHNPEFTDMIQQLSGRPVDHMPTCTVANFYFDTGRWQSVGHGAELVRFEFNFPKNVST